MADDVMTPDQAAAAGFAPPDDITTGSVGDEQALTPEQARAQGFAPTHEDDDEVLTPEEASKMGFVPPESEGATFLREAAHGVLPMAASIGPMMAGGAYGAEIGAAGGPIGSVVGGLVGAAAGGMLAGGAASTVQEGALKASGFDDTAQRAANAAENPKSAMLGGLAPVAVTFNAGLAEGKLADQLAQRMLMGGGVAGVNAGEQYVEKGTVDPLEVGANFAAGAVFNKTNKPFAGYAQAGEELGSRLGKATAENVEKGWRHAFPGDNAANADADRAVAATSEPLKQNTGNAPTAPPVLKPDDGAIGSARAPGNDEAVAAGQRRTFEKVEGNEGNFDVTQQAEVEQAAKKGGGTSVGDQPTSDPTLASALKGEEAELPANAKPANAKPAMQEGQPQHSTVYSDEVRNNSPLGPEWQPPKGDEFARSNLNARPQKTQEALAPQAQTTKIARAPKGRQLVLDAPINAPAASPEARPTAKEPKVVQETIDMLKSSGKGQLAKAIEVLPPGEARNKLATRLNAAELSQKGTLPENPVAVRSRAGHLKNLEVQGTVNPRSGRPYRTKTPEMAKRYSEVISKAEQAAFNPKFEPKENENATAVQTRVKAMLEEARRQNPERGKLPHETYTMNGLDKPKGFSLIRRADQFLKGKIKEEDGIKPYQRFLADEKLHRGSDEAYKAFVDQNRMEATNALGKQGKGKTLALEDVEASLGRKEVASGQAESAVDLPTHGAALDENETLAERAAREAREDAEAEGQAPAVDHMAPFEADFQRYLKQVPAPQREFVEKGIREKVNKNPDLLDEKGGFNAIRKMLPTRQAMARDKMPREGSLEEINKKLTDALSQKADEISGKLEADIKSPPEGRVDEFSRTPKTEGEHYARKLGHELEQLGGVDVNDAMEAVKLSKAMPESTRGARLWDAYESNALKHLDAKEQAEFERHVKPILDDADRLYDNIETLAPGMLGPKVQSNYMYRIAKNTNDPKLDALFRDTEYSGDPIAPRDLAPSRRGPTFERKYFAGVDTETGRRIIISQSKDGYTEWNNRTPTILENPSFKMEEGATFKNPQDDKTYRIEQAKVDEITKHTGEEYFKNPAMSAILARLYLQKIAGHLQFMQQRKNDPLFLKFAQPEAKNGQPGISASDARERGWKDTKLSTFDNWYMDPQLAQMFDHYARPGFADDSLAWLSNLSQSVTRLMFWMPTAHLANVGAHWFVARGWDWVKIPAYRDLYVDGMQGIKSVISQDGLQAALRRVGAPLMAGRLMTRDTTNIVGENLGEVMKKAPAKWDPIAKVFGMGAAQLADAVYKGSSRIMWAGNDMFMTQLALEKLRGMGVKDWTKATPAQLDAASLDAARHFPSYRTPAAILKANNFGRAIGKVLREPAAVAFGPYHYGAMNSFAHIVKDLTNTGKPLTDPARIEAIGNLMAMGMLAFMVKPVLDKMAQVVTGDKSSEAHPRGPLSLPTNVYRALQGKAEVSEAAQGTLTLSPAMTTVLQALEGRDFAGRKIISRGDVYLAAHGSPKAALRVAGQGAEFTARGLLPPYNTAANAWSKREGPVKTIAEQALDIKTKSPAAKKYEAEALKKAMQERAQRIKKPTGPIEYLTR